MKKQHATALVSVALAALFFALGTGEASAVPITIPTVPVGYPGNAPDSTGRGSVAYEYRMGTTEVTTNQYMAFLNAVAATDTYGLYSSGSGIIQSGSPNSYSYSVSSGYNNLPVVRVSWGSAARFANWLTNNQPTGAEGPGTTETGSYNLNGAVTANPLLAITRSTDAKYVIPSEDEWYKAAYYQPAINGVGLAHYWAYPTRTNSTISNDIVDAGNNANFDNGGSNPGYVGMTVPAPPHLTQAGHFATSLSPFGTLDQGGNAWEWTEALYSLLLRQIRGGAYDYNQNYLGPVFGDLTGGTTPTATSSDIGFRVEYVPEPSTLAMAVLGVAALATWGWRRKRCK